MKNIILSSFIKVKKCITNKIHIVSNFLQGNLKERKEDLNIIKAINKIGASFKDDFNNIDKQNYSVTFYGVSLENSLLETQSLDKNKYKEVVEGFYAIVCNTLNETLQKLYEIITKENLKDLSLKEIHKIETVVSKMLSDNSSFLMIVSSSKNSKIHPHYHVSNEYVYVVRGECRNKLNNTLYQEHTFFMHAPFEIHSLETLSDKLILLVSLDGK
jgi:quercetin dioxygenase-like cupin family protein